MPGTSSSTIGATTGASPVAFSVSMKIDWERNGFLSSGLNLTYMDVTADLVTSVRCFRGRDQPNPLIGRCGPGSLTFFLRNESLLYSSENALSPLHGKINPKTPVRWETAYGRRFSGKVKSFAFARIGQTSVPAIAVTVEGPLAELPGVRISPPADGGSASDYVMNRILDAVGFTGGRSFQVGQTTLSRWYVSDKDALEAAREVEEAERGFLYETSDYDISFNNRIDRINGSKLTPVATFGDVYNPPSAANLSYGMYSAIEQLDSSPFVVNDATVVVTPYAEDSLAELWRLTGEVPVLQPGEERTWLATYPNSGTPNGAYVSAWTTLTSSDVTITGGPVFADLTITLVKNATNMSIKIKNNAGSNATLTLLRARGVPVIKGTPTALKAQNAASIAIFGLQSYRLSTPWLPSTPIGQSYVDFIANNYGLLRRALRVKFVASMSVWLFAMLGALELGMRVTIMAVQPRTGLNFTLDFFIERIEDYFDIEKHRYEITMELSQVGTETEGGGGLTADLWIVGTSTLDHHTYLDA